MSDEKNPNLVTPVDLKALCNGGTLFEFRPEEHFKNHNFLVDTFDELAIHDDDDDYSNTGDINKGAPGTQSFEEIAKKMVNVSESDLIKKRLLREGYGEAVTEDVEVHFHYNAFWERENSPYDSTYMRGYPQKMKPNQHEVLEGIEAAIMTMKMGEEAIFLISYELLYGERGCPPRIRPKANAMFMIEVIKVCPYVMELNNEQSKMFPFAYKNASILHLEAVREFQTGKIGLAIRKFEKAVDMLEKARLVNDEEEMKQNKFLIKLYTNLAVGFNKEKKPYRACSMCNELNKLTNINKSSKILFQFGRALMEIQEYEPAKEKLLKAYKLEPNNTEIGSELSKLEKRIKLQKKTEIEFYSRALGVTIEKTETLENISEEFMEEVKSVLNVFIENDTKTDFTLNGAYTDEEIKYFKKVANEYNLRFEESKVNNQYTYVFNKQ